MIAQIFGYTYPHSDYIIAIKMEYFNKKLINIRTFFLGIAQIVSTKQKRPKNGSNYIKMSYRSLNIKLCHTGVERSYSGVQR